jgi:hypothetical protein
MVSFMIFAWRGFVIDAATRRYDDYAHFIMPAISLAFQQNAQ